MDEKEQKKIEEQELMELQKDILSAKNQNELVQAMQRYNLWREETSTNNVKPKPIQNTYNYDISRQRSQHTVNFRNPEYKLKTYRQRIGYISKEEKLQNRLNRARRLGLSEADIELLKKLSMEDVLDED